MSGDGDRAADHLRQAAGPDRSRLSRLGLDEQKFLVDADATRTHLSDIALGSPFQPQLTGRRSGADDLLRGPDPEFFELVCLTPRPGHELVEVPGVKPPVRVR